MDEGQERALLDKLEEMCGLLRDIRDGLDEMNSKLDDDNDITESGDK